MIGHNPQLFFGVVEDRKDPMMLGRCRVRILGVHNPNTTELPTTDLPWAYPVTPITTAGVSGIGHSPTGPVEGTWVVILFRDEAKQQPLMIGSIGGVPMISGSGSTSPEGMSCSGAPEPAFNPTTGALPVKERDAPLTDEIGKPVTPQPDSPKVDSLRGNSNAERAYNFFIDKGYTPAAAAGITGNLMMESGGRGGNLNTTALGDGALGSYGIAQWNGARKQGLNKYAASIGKAPSDLQTQLEYIDIEARGKDTPYAGGRNGGNVYQALNGIQDPKAAANIFRDKYERCNKAVCGNNQRADLAQQVYNKQGNLGVGTENIASTSSGASSSALGYGAINSTSGCGGSASAPSSDQGFRDPFNNYPRYAKEQDTNRLARGQNLRMTSLEHKIVGAKTGMPFANIKGKEKKWGQPLSPYNGKYPYNHVYMSESGHIMEFDDTAGSERINLEHKSGTFLEIDTAGTQVNKIVGNGYTIYDNDGYIAIDGTCIVSVGKDVSIYVQGGASIEVMGETNIHSAGALNVLCDKQISIETPKDIDIKCKDFNLTCNQVNMKLDSSFEVTAGSLIAGDAPAIKWNSGAANPTEAEPQFNYFSPKLKEIPSSSYQAEGAAAEAETFLDLDYPDSDGGSAGTGVPSGTYNDKGELVTKDDTPAGEKVAPKNVDFECADGTISNSAQMSKSTTVNDWVKSKGGGGSVKSQHGLTDKQIACNMKYVAENVYEPVKELYPEAQITSGFRYDGNYAAQGGGRVSQHEVGEAVDISFPGYTDEQIFAAAQNLKTKIPYDQMIYEQTNSGTILHVSLKQNATPRYDERHLVYVGGKPSYPSGLTMRSK